MGEVGLMMVMRGLFEWGAGGNGRRVRWYG